MSFYISSGVITPPLTAGAVAYGTGSTALMNSAGTASQVLLSGGANAPTWASVSTVVPQATATVLGTVYGSETTSGGTPFLTAYGYNAGAVNTGVNNTFMGVSAGLVNVGGTDNVAIGYQSLKANISGTNNIAIGVQSLNANTASNNIGIGYQSGLSITTGGQNVGIGYLSLSSNLIGDTNTAVGSQSLKSNTNSDNTAVGYNAGLGLTSGVQNSYLGSSCGGQAGTGSYNTILGALAGNAATGSSNTYVGRAVANSSTSGDSNTGVGMNALVNLTTGATNVAIGHVAGTEAGVVNITNQSNYIAIGNNSSTNAYIKIAWTVTSDARDKTEIQPVPHGLNFINQLNPVSFKFTKSRVDATSTGDVRYGFLAQDILALEGADSVVIDAKDAENLKYTDQNMTAILVKALQELNAKFESYKEAHP